MIEITEDMIVDAAKVMEALEGNNTNGFSTALENGAEIKKHGLTPIYMFDQEEHGIYVLIKETYGKKLH